MKKIAIVGAGPSGFYLAQQLLKAHKVTMFEALLTPFGLVRYGVAPDHFSVKNSAAKFEKIAQHENLDYIGNCTVGRDISISTLLANLSRGRTRLIEQSKSTDKVYFNFCNVGAVLFWVCWYLCSLSCF